MIDQYTIILGLLVVLFYFWTLKPTPDQDPKALIKQALVFTRLIKVSSSRNDGETAIYRHPLNPFGKRFLDTIDNLTTMYEVYWDAVSRFPNDNHIGKRINNGPFVFETFKAISERVDKFGNALLDKLKLGQTTLTDIIIPGRFVGIFMNNSPDRESLVYVLNHTELPCIVLDSRKIDMVLELAPQTPHLKTLIIADIDSIDDLHLKRAKDLKISLATFSAMEKASNRKYEHVKPTPETTVTICYTSGTTGPPKGVMISHRNLVSGLGGFKVAIPEHLKLTQADKHLSFLPLSHIMERVIFHSLSYFGCPIAIYRGSIPLLLEDIAEFKPTFFVAVPRVLNKIYDQAMSKLNAAPWLGRKIFDFCYQQKLELLKKGCVSRNTIWDRILFRRIQRVLGGNIRGIVTGSAPISPEVLVFMRVVFGCFVLEGYGQTESTAAGFVSNYGDHIPRYGAHVGVPSCSIEYKLVDVPELNYFVTDVPNPRGEIWLRGPLITKGYYKNEKKTRETIDENGWLSTGDIGEVSPNLTLKIIDRVKNIFKLSQGEFVAPDAIESKLKDPVIQQIFIHGTPLESYLVAIVVPEEKEFQSLGKSLGETDLDIDKFRSNPRVIQEVLNRIDKAGRNVGLKSFQIPKKIWIEHVPFTVDNGLLTPTLKTKRDPVREKYAEVLKALYAK